MRWRRCWVQPRNTEKTSAVLENSEGSERRSRKPTLPQRPDRL